MEDPWQIKPNPVAAAQPLSITNGILDVVGVKVTSFSQDGEAKTDGRVMFAEGGGMVGLFRDEHGFVFVQARAEAGQKGVLVSIKDDRSPQSSRVLASPTVQFSFGNLRKNGGNILFADRLVKLFPPASEGGTVRFEMLPDIAESQDSDGGRFFEKTNHLAIVHVCRADIEDALVGRPEAVNYVRVDLKTLVAARKAGLVSEHLRGLMGSLLEA